MKTTLAADLRIEDRHAALTLADGKDWRLTKASGCWTSIAIGTVGHVIADREKLGFVWAGQHSARFDRCNAIIWDGLLMVHTRNGWAHFEPAA